MRTENMIYIIILAALAGLMVAVWHRVDAIKEDGRACEARGGIAVYVDRGAKMLCVSKDALR